MSCLLRVRPSLSATAAAVATTQQPSSSAAAHGLHGLSSSCQWQTRPSAKDSYAFSQTTSIESAGIRSFSTWHSNTIIKSLVISMTRPEELNFAESFTTRPFSSGKKDASSISEENEDADAENWQECLTEAEQFLAQAVDISQKIAISTITVEKAIKNLCDAYNRISEHEDSKKQFLLKLADQGINEAQSVAIANEFSETPSPRNEERLRQVLTPTYVNLFKLIGRLEGGVKFLVDLRSDIIDLSRSDFPTLKAMNGQLKQLLSHWFSVGFLDLEQVTWSSPCSMLQKVSDYEAVHPMRNWTDLKSRVGAYRRCFVYTHKSMPGEPIVVLHVALTEDIPRAISSVVRHHRLIKRFTVDTQSGLKTAPEGEDITLCAAAIFYSITSTQRGLQGIELGTHLIKDAVHSLKEKLPNLVHYSSLSPIPGFRKWLLTQMQEDETLFKPEELKELKALLNVDEDQVLSSLISSLKSNLWPQEEALKGALETPLMRLCARYLYVEKHRGHALDAVANFHLRNGAVLWRINWLGDLSVRGLTNSCGIMVNYKYFLDDLENNSTSYQEKNVIKASEQVLHLVSKK